MVSLVAATFATSARLPDLAALSYLCTLLHILSSIFYMPLGSGDSDHIALSAQALMLISLVWPLKDL